MCYNDLQAISKTWDSFANHRLGMQRVQVMGDGNCYFRALAVALTGTEEGHLELREKLWQYVTDNLVQLNSQLSNVLDGLYIDERAIEELKTPGVFVSGDLFVLASAQMLSTPVIVLKYSDLPIESSYKPAGF